MRVERPSTKHPGQIDLLTVCDNPSCESERYNGYTAPWVMLATFGSFTPDGWLSVGFEVDACSWACLAAAAAVRATEAPVA